MYVCDFKMTFTYIYLRWEELHMIHKFFSMQLQIQMLGFLGHLDVNNTIIIKLSYVDEFNK